MPSPSPALDASVARADWHRLRGDILRIGADSATDPEEAERLTNRASVAYALAETITLRMKDEGHA